MKFSRLSNFIKFDSNRSVALDSEIIKVALEIKSNACDVYEPFQLFSRKAKIGRKKNIQTMLSESSDDRELPKMYS